MDKSIQSNNLLADFCSMKSVLLVIVIMLLLAIVKLLVPAEQPVFSWASLGMLAMFLLWIGLLSLAVLCMLSPLLGRMGILSGSLLTFILIQLVTLAVSEAAYLMTQHYVVLSYMAPEQHEWFLLRNVVISMIISGVALRYMFLQKHLQVRIEAQNQAQIQALQARIRPHFLFNSMNTIAALTHVDADAAERAVLDLSEIYRATLNADDSLTTLADEVALTRYYLEVEKLRLHERLNVSWQIDDSALPTRLPALVIQPLVENAVYHGIEPLTDGGTVTIEAVMDDKLRISIRNPLPSEGDQTQRRGNQMAIKNIRDRLNIAYGAQSSLKSSQDDREYRVVIEVPLTES